MTDYLGPEDHDILRMEREEELAGSPTLAAYLAAETRYHDAVEAVQATSGAYVTACKARVHAAAVFGTARANLAAEIAAEFAAEYDANGYPVPGPGWIA